MQALRNKTILIISPQAWGKMFLSKHHYAIELAKRGNTVYFLNPPGENNIPQKKSIEIISSGAEDNLWIINHKLWFPYNIKFHAMLLFHALMKPHVKKIKKKIPQPIDIIWSFDLGNYYPFYFFGKKAYKVFHPVDEPLNKTAIDSAKGCDIIFSVTREILEKYSKYPVPKYFINHGVSEKFFLSSNEKFNDGRIRVGFSGNLLRNDIDRQTLLNIITSNPEIIFEFFGSYTQKQSNISGVEDDDLKNFVASLQSRQNVVLHGAVAYEILAEAIQNMDAFLICYDIKKDQSKGTNYHKIMEYLSTGKVIVSNNVTTYKNEPELLQMTSERENNLQLPGLFKKIISDLQFFNRSDLQQKRIAFAKNNSYQKQIERIEEIILQNEK